jgi:two-component system sensor kinase FixL
MIAIAVCVATVLIVLLKFEAIRRVQQKGVSGDSPHVVQPSTAAYTNYAFALQGNGDSLNSDPIASTQSDLRHVRDAASFRTPWAARRPSIRARFQKFKTRHFREDSLSVGSPPCPGKTSSNFPTQQWSEARPLHGDDQFSCALDLLPLAVIVADPNGEIVFANVAAGELFGYPIDELVGANALKLGAALKPPWPFSDSQSSQPGLHAGPGSGLREVVVIRKNGIEFPVDISDSHISTAREDYSLSIIMDRTERNELARNRQQLAHLSRVATLGELTGSLAHELNQPLTAILSNAQAAQRFMTMEPTNLTEVREILHDLVQDTHRASEVIRKIRALVKKGEIEAAPLSMATVIRDVALLVHSDAIVRGIRVAVTAAPELPPVQGDKVQLQQVILNLLLNAFDAMEDCALLERVVSIKSSFDPAGEVRIAVRDCGTGISHDRISKLFVPFFTSKRDGLGLGLSISRSIVELHGGRIWAENNQDRGATFYFTLPAGVQPGSVSSKVTS